MTAAVTAAAMRMAFFMRQSPWLVQGLMGALLIVAIQVGRANKSLTTRQRVLGREGWKPQSRGAEPEPGQDRVGLVPGVGFPFLVVTLVVRPVGRSLRLVLRAGKPQRARKARKASKACQVAGELQLVAGPPTGLDEPSSALRRGRQVPGRDVEVDGEAEAVEVLPVGGAGVELGTGGSQLLAGAVEVAPEQVCPGEGEPAVRRAELVPQAVSDREGLHEERLRLVGAAEIEQAFGARHEPDARAPRRPAVARGLDRGGEEWVALGGTAHVAQHHPTLAEG